VDHQQILDICLIPGKALAGPDSNNRAAWAMLSSIGWHMTGFEKHHALPTPTSFFWLSRDDLVKLFSYRRSAFEPMEDLLKISIDDHVQLGRMCRINPAMAAATAYHSMIYFLPTLPERNEIRDSWACFKRMLSPQYARFKWYDGPALWAISYSNGWKLANKLFDGEQKADESEVIAFPRKRRKSVE
jgi:hypothetical protein